MPGKRINRQQVEFYMTERRQNTTQVVSAKKAGISERSGRRIEQGQCLAQSKQRHWRTRPDPLDKVWENELAPMLTVSPGLSGITLLEYLQDKYPGEHPDQLLRTLQRRVKQWRALAGPKKEVMFRQSRQPGQQGLSDFTQLKDIRITIQGIEYKHLLYHFRLAYSGWSYVKAIQGGESFTALAEGLQEALWRLGGAPLEHRTDSLSAAFCNCREDQREDLSQRYESLCQHYNLLPTRNNRGKGHENGAIESPHGHIKRRIKQGLLLRGSNDFKSVDVYQQWLAGVVRQHNKRNAKALSVERPCLQALPIYKTTDFTEVMARVSSSSTIDVRRVTYTVPSQLEGEYLRVHLYHDRLECFFGTTHVIKLRRIHTTGKERARQVDYRHVIHSLVKKPQAFRYSQLRDDLLPNDDYRQIWQHVNQYLSAKPACKFIVGLLDLAAKYNCEAELANTVLEQIAQGKTLSLSGLKQSYSHSEVTVPNIIVRQHDLSSYDNLLSPYSWRVSLCLM
ncbi:MAG: IS21 family transposase [Nitrosomonadaceae bacterium]